MIFITKSGKEIQVPNDYTYMSIEKFAKEIYQQGIEDATKDAIEKIIDFVLTDWGNIEWSRNEDDCIQVKDILFCLKHILKNNKN